MCHVGIDRALFVSEGGFLFRAFIPRLHAHLGSGGDDGISGRQFCLSL